MTTRDRASMQLWIAAILVLAGWGAPCARQAAAQEGEIRLIVRGDDMGFCHAANEACIQCCREGITKSIEVMVPGPWYKEAVKMLKENPSVDVGVHLTLNSEWEGCKWGPITKAPSLCDKYGYFSVRLTPQRPNLPLDPTAAPALSKLEELERELDAQIQLAVADIPQVSHLTCHMGTPTATRELRAIVEKLSEKYRLPLEAPGVKHAGSMGGPRAGPEERESAMVRLVEQLGPGTWLLVEHPGLDTPEMQAISLAGGESVAVARAGVTRAWTSQRVKDAIAKRGIRLISYADYHRK